MGRKKLTDEERQVLQERKDIIESIHEHCRAIPDFRYDEEREAFINLVVCNLFSVSSIDDLSLDGLNTLENFCRHYAPIIDWKVCKIRELEGMLKNLKGALNDNSCRCRNYGY